MSQIVESLEEAVGDSSKVETESDVALKLNVVVYELKNLGDSGINYEPTELSYDIKPGIANAVTIGFGDEYGINLEKPTDEQRSWLTDGVELEDGSSDAEGTGNQGYGSLVFCECDGLNYVPRKRTKTNLREVRLQRAEEMSSIRNTTQIETEDALSIAPTIFENNPPLYLIHIAEVTQA
jgi:hypothetical protein